MKRATVLRMCAVMIVAGGAALSAQLQFPSTPPKEFGGGVTPSFEGWFDNADGSHTFLVGYYSRNTRQEVDIPIGPNNHFEPGPADLGQPTHFLTRRRRGMFTVPVPKEFGKSEKLWWSLTVNGTTNRIPFHLHTDYRVSAFKSMEQSPNGVFSQPPILRFEMRGPSFQGPMANTAKPLSHSASVGVPMPLNIWADDDALFSSSGNAAMRNAPPPVELVVSKYRGPGEVKVNEAKLEALKGGQPEEPYSGKASTSVTFSEPGEYLLHVTAKDYTSEHPCCWTNIIIKVTVSEAGSTGR
jgi:hypothetical protein